MFLPVWFSFWIWACDWWTEAACCAEDIGMCCELYPDNIICTPANWWAWAWWWNCVILTLINWSTLDYCWPSECESSYEAFWNNPQNTSLQQEYTNCIAQYWPDNSWWPLDNTDCDALSSEIQWFWPTWPYSLEQQSKIDLYSQLQCPCGDKRYAEWSERKCCDWIIENWQCIVNNAWNMWIEMNPDCLINWQCKFDIYQTLWIRQSLPRETRSSPWIFIQDIILSATFFVGTLITAVLIISWLLYVFAWVNAGLADKAKKWITWSLIWLLFVVWSYAFVRLIQFLVTWWGG